LSNQNPPPDSGSQPDDHKPLIDGGSVDSIDARLSYGQSDPKDTERRGKLAFGLVLLLSGLLLAQYVSIAVLNWGDKAGAIKSLESTFNAALPVISGLVSSAVTYYFTRNNPHS
jgi:hypothetical protein